MKSFEFKSIPILIIIVLAGCALRVYHLGTKRLWLDEMNTLHTATGHGSVTQTFPFPPADHEEPQLDRDSTFRSVIESATNTFHPPFYFLLLNVWMRCFGDSKIGCRSLSVVLGVISVIVIFIIGKQLFDAQTGLISSAIFALSTTQIHYAQEARMYPLAVLLGLVSTSLLVQIIQGRSNDILTWVGYVVTNILALYTHYYLTFLLLVHGAVVIPKCKSCRNIVNRWLFALLIIILLFLPYIPHASSVANRVSIGHWTSAGNPRVQPHMKFAHLWPLSTIPHSFIHFSLDVVRILDDPVLDVRMLVCSGAIGVCVLAFLSAYGIWALRKRRDVLMFLGFWFLIPMLAAIAVDVIMGTRASIVTEARYYLYSSPAYYLLLARGLVSLTNQRWRIISVVILLEVNMIFLLRHYSGTIS
jgi:uncharacterized membrane protein